MNGDAECNGDLSSAPAKRANLFTFFATQLDLEIDPSEDLTCQTMQPFDSASSAANAIYYALDSTSSEPACELVGTPTPWNALRPGDYAACVDYYFRAHWFWGETLVAEYGGAPGSSRP
eukprot:Gregarina_sp_Poly_1__8522@NODE_502_length_7877_cov_467_844558_g402_i0_p5_GENE_NODE_502_length_7877_cov_467_844558_g402_i0NODE_502_length_7877_cov_467_844558_g402_i0_p5_ORF_typecomplete_len119_score21_30_NODE_502_length_7877_cov_467_844558_g402_i058236179